MGAATSKMAASPPGTGGKESLRNELAGARSRLTALHQEKEHLLMNMKDLQAILDKERRELREVLGQAKAKIDQVNSDKKAVESRLSETEVTVREQAARIKELEDLLRQLRAELNSGGSSMTAVAFISAASSVDEVFSRQWSNKSREEPAITVLEPLVLKLRSVFQSESQCKSELLNCQQSASEAQARHERELAALQRRLDEEIAARAAMESSCGESDARYQAVAKELAKNNQEIHSWRTDERLSMERQLAELRALLEKSRGTIDELSQDRAQRDNRIVKLEHEVSDANTTITELREEIDQLRARLKDTAQQLAEAHAQLGADRNSSSELAAIIKQLELELEQLKRQLEQAQGDLNAAHADTIASKVGLGIETIERMIWLQRTIWYCTSFYQWKAEAHAMAMQRGANELAEIVASVETDRVASAARVAEFGGPSVDDWDINALDINAIAGEFGL